MLEREKVCVRECVCVSVYVHVSVCVCVFECVPARELRKTTERACARGREAEKERGKK